MRQRVVGSTPPHYKGATKKRKTLVCNVLNVVRGGYYKCYPQIVNNYCMVSVGNVYCAMSMMCKIYDTDTVYDIARKIFNEFDIGAMCRVSGFFMDEKANILRPKGEIVIEQLKDMDLGVNCKKYTNGIQRKYVYKKNSIGGPISHKIFTWEKHVVDNEVRITIWRFQ